MPVQYTSIVDEHLAVRRASGIFDISHMGELVVSGPLAAGFLNACLTNDIRKLAVGQGQYTLLCQAQGGVIDDLYAYRLESERYLLILNASRIDVDVAWFQARWAENNRWTGGVTLDAASDRLAAVAIQGPRVAEYINSLFPGSNLGGTSVAHPSQLKKNQVGAWAFQNQPVWVARTGYTGEDGFEVITPSELIESVWDQALALGKAVGQQPCGLGARDTLRTEVCFPLYGHELDENTTPIEAGLGVFVSFEKGDFCGRDVLAAQKAAGVTRKSVAFRMTEKAPPPRPGYGIWINAESVGTVVSGTQSPSLNNGIGMGYVPSGFSAPGQSVEIEIRGRRYGAEIVRKPLYRKA